MFENLALKDAQSQREGAQRISLDCQATVRLGEFSRGGKTRGDNRARDDDMGIQEKYIPCGIVDEDTGELFISFGNSDKTSDLIVDTLPTWWAQLSPKQQKSIPLLQIKVDNGSESSGMRTQFLNRMVQWVERLGLPVQLLYYPPYHSKYNPIERCWGMLEQYWHGALLTDVQTMVAWAKSMTWKGLHPVVELSHSIYEKGISLTKKQICLIEERWERNPLLPKYDVLIYPA